MIFSRLEAMEWNHLYTAGGLEDQNPTLLEFFDVLFREKAKFDKEENDKREREMKAKSHTGGMRRMSSGRRR